MMLRVDVFKNYCDKSLETLKNKEEKIRLQLLEEPGNIKLKKELGNILYYKKDIDGAINVYLKLITLEPKSASHNAFLGYLYYEK